jgi:hypothetical protein
MWKGGDHLFPLARATGSIASFTIELLPQRPADFLMPVVALQPRQRRSDPAFGFIQFVSIAIPDRSSFLLSLGEPVAGYSLAVGHHQSAGGP